MNFSINFSYLYNCLNNVHTCSIISYDIHKHKLSKSLKKTNLFALLKKESPRQKINRI